MRGDPHGLSGGAPSGGGPPWGTIECLLTPCLLFPTPDAVLMGCEHHRDKIDGLEVACCSCICKGSAAATEGSIFEAEQGVL